MFDEVSVASLARNFSVSEQAMSIRLQQLKLLELNIEMGDDVTESASA